MRYAVIDLGTNTFHLLVVESSEYGKWETLVRHKIFVKLGEEGLRKIGNSAFQRGLSALKTFKMQLDAVGIAPRNVRAYGTAALRMAGNADKLVHEILHETGITVNIISGMQEANLIYRGVRRAVPFPDNHVLIMDIGGGSVELIIADRNKVYWQGSFDIGVSVLYGHFHKSDPIHDQEVVELEDFLEVALKEFWVVLAKYHVPTIIGASVAFDIIDNFMLDKSTRTKLYGYANISDFNAISEMLINTSLAEREDMPELAPERIEMIVVALCLLRYIQKKGNFKEIYSSEYSLKEGMLEELM